MLVVAVALVLFLGRAVQVAQVVVARGGQVLLPAPVLLVRLIPAVAVEAVALVLLTLPAAQAAPASSSSVTRCLARQYLPSPRQSHGLLPLVR